MLVRLRDIEARRKAEKLGFQLTTDPLEFVTKIVRAPACMRKGHVVLAPLVDTDCSLSARIVAALVGAFIIHHATGCSQSGRIAARHHVHREVQELEREFSRGCISRSRGRVAHSAATFESHRYGPRKLFHVLLVRTQVVQVFQKDGEESTADAEEYFCSLQEGRPSYRAEEIQRAVH